MTAERRAITEQDTEQDAWYAQATEQTLETLPAFLRHLTEDYAHDYGTICHALAAGAVATAWAMNKSPAGGITAFQGGAVMWEFVEHWSGPVAPAKLQRYEHLLYPQYEHDFRCIDPETWDWVQAQARERLAAYEAKPVHTWIDDGGETQTMPVAAGSVVEHWRRIASGWVPFGIRLGE